MSIFGKMMKPIHILLATFVAVIWGVAFVISKIGLEHFSAPQLTALRFLVASAAVVFLPRPDVSPTVLIGIGATIFAGQFLLQFFGLSNGMPAGLTAATVQMQALFTVLIAAVVLGEKPNAMQVIGMLVAFAGLAMIGFTLDVSIPPLAFLLVLGSAISWALGNILVKRLPRIDMLRLMVWASLVPPLPALAISAVTESPSMLSAMSSTSWPAILAPVYLGLVASVLAYAIWGNLLQRYSAASVAPFALLAPGVGAVASAFVFGESFGSFRLAGMILIVAGVAIAVVVPARSTKVVAQDKS